MLSIAPHGEEVKVRGAERAAVVFCERQSGWASDTQLCEFSRIKPAGCDVCSMPVNRGYGSDW